MSDREFQNMLNDLLRVELAALRQATSRGYTNTLDPFAELRRNLEAAGRALRPAVVADTKRIPDTLRDMVEG